MKTLLIVAFLAISMPAHAEDFTLDKPTLAKIEKVNRKVNRDIHPMSDLEHYGVADKWVTEPADGLGDCEDYAATKMARLVAIGIPEAAMLIEGVGMRDGTRHAVLVIRDGKRAVVLDNRTPWITDREKLAASYTFGF